MAASRRKKIAAACLSISCVLHDLKSLLSVQDVELKSAFNISFQPLSYLVDVNKCFCLGESCLTLTCKIEVFETDVFWVKKFIEYSSGICN